MIPGGLAVDRSDRGALDEPLIVCIHGVMDRAASFRRTMRRLESLDVVAFDRRGYAGSLGLGASEDLTRHVADAIAVAAGRRCVLVGHSFGAVIALRAAAERPDLVAALALYEPPVGWVEGVERPPPLIAVEEPPSAVAEAFFIATVGARAWARLPERTRAVRLAEGPAIGADLRMAGTGPGVALGDVLQPVWIAHGDDPGGRYGPGAQRLAQLVPDGRVQVFDGVGHGVHLSHPDRFAAWIRSVPARIRG